MDNNNEAGIRSGADEFPAPEIAFSLDGGNTYTELTADHMEFLGLEELPEGTVTADAGAYTYRIAGGTLPTEITCYDEYGDSTEYSIQWKITPKSVDGYQLTDAGEGVPDGYPKPQDEKGWYYSLLTEYSFEYDIRWGVLDCAEEIMNAVLDGFQFQVSVGTQDVYSMILSDFSQAGNLSIAADSGSPGRGTIKIMNIPKYSFDGSAVTYTVIETDATGMQNGIRLPDELQDPGDYFAFYYDNSAAPNVGGETGAVYNGGKLVLTLTGIQDYQAEKEWQDADREDDIDRPTGVFQLWRYRAGNSYTTASPVYNAGAILEIALDTNQNSQRIQFTDSEGNPVSLPKYDSEGYAYIYVVREYLEEGDVGSYKQVFGELFQSDEGTEIRDTVLELVDGELENTGSRTDGNDFIYQGGTLSNTLVGTIDVPVVKTWKAEAFQTAFDDVTVVLTLQQKLAQDSDGIWTDTDIQITMDQFYAENLTVSAEKSAPRYDAMGREIAYRWIETGVYQGKGNLADLENLLSVKTDGERTFVLEQDGEKVEYTSSAEKLDDGSTVITNSISDTIIYEVDKIWLDEQGDPMDPPPQDAQVTFSIYRAVSGEPVIYDEPVITLTMDGKQEEGMVTTPEGVVIAETGDWSSVISELPEYNEEGLLYEYFLLETSGYRDYFPVCETSRIENGGYHTDVYNGPGDGNIIIVQKYWTDSSDVQHRENVTLQIYHKGDDLPIGEPVVLGDGVWQRYVSIGEYEPDEVYILETRVGNHSVPLTSYQLGEGVPNYDDPQEPALSSDPDYTAIQYEACYHRYEATYGRETVGAGSGIEQELYSVTNRRLGNINLKVEKEWLDGEGTRRREIQKELEEIGADAPRLVMELQFGPGSSDQYEMTRDEPGGDTVDLATYPVAILDDQGNPAGSRQEVDLARRESVSYFYNLPKYDIHGSVAAYQIEEVWLRADGTVLSLKEMEQEYPDLYALAAEYQTTSDSEYTVAEDSLHAIDVQTVSVTNRLTGSKQVQWHKTWNDAYTNEIGERPDIYLDIYRVIHNSSQETDTKTEIYIANYRWMPNEKDSVYRWTAILNSLPKYDSYGYEITYYALEHTAVDSAAFGYRDTEYSLDTGGTSMDLGTALHPAAGAEDGHYVISVPNDAANSGRKGYALVQEGTFTNSIEGTISIQGQKLWQSLPAGFVQEDLPSVTFTVYRWPAGSPDQKEEIAELTVEEGEWSGLYENGSYQYRILYEGENDLEIDGGTVTVIAKDGGQELDRFDETGRLYEYSVEEKTAFGQSLQTEVDAVYGDPVVNVFVVSNYYDSVTGAAAFRKVLALPLGTDGSPETYPAVTFEISRTYITKDGGISEKEVIRTVTWTSREVREAYEKAAVQNPNITEVTGTFMEEDLEVYAPNGSEYTYRVEEIKTNLNGYETWVCQGEKDTVSAVEQAGREETVSDGLTVVLNQADQEGTPGRGDTADAVDVSVTFANRKDPDRDTKILTGKKVWNDYGMGFRPDELKITLSRHAASQPGQDNPLDETLNENDYRVTWTGKDSDTWIYTITAADGVSGLERYAPNGMEWMYQVKEEAPEYYTPNPAGGAVTEAVGTELTNGVKEMQTLTNSMKISESFTKTWVDSEGETIGEDYLGYDIRVTFSLQAAEASADGKLPAGGSYQAAETYFRSSLSQTDYENLFDGYVFEKTIAGGITETGQWRGSFANLPSYVKKAGQDQAIRLIYRVVETSISYGQVTQTVTVDGTGDSYTYQFGSGIFSPYYQDGTGADPGAANSSENNSQINMLKTTGLQITKTWEGDAGNSYGSRPETGRTGFTWETSFVLQGRLGDTEEFSNVMVSEGTVSRPLIITLYGDNSQDTVQSSVSGLPEYGMKDGQTFRYTYRVRELQPDYQADDQGRIDEKYLTEPDGSYHGTYTAEYGQDGLSVTNSLRETKVYAEKRWNPGMTAGYPQVTLKLQYLGSSGNWVSFRPEASVTLDGSQDAESAYYEYEAWKAVWNHLPLSMPGSDLDRDGKTQYRVVETVPSGYLQESSDTGNKTENGAEYEEFIFVNVPETFISVSKNWYGTNPASEVTVGLWRYITEGGETKEPEEVTDSSGSQRKILLNAKNHWAGTVTDLPAYDQEGNAYTYYARELTIGDEPAKDSDYRIVYKDEALPGGGFSTDVANIGRTEIAGTKTWKDYGNVYQTRPDSLPLTLYRQIPGGAEMPVSEETMKAEGAVLGWENTDSDLWSYHYRNLPAADDNGNLYTYRVEETVPETGIDGDRYDSSQNGYDLTNKLTGSVDVPVTKIWTDGGDADHTRPEALELVLFGNGTEKDRVSINLKETSYSGDRWTYTFKNLPKYDEEGKKIAYTVNEDSVPAGYRSDVDTETGTITNTLLTSLTVSKIWGGISGEYQKEVTVGLYRKSEGENLQPVLGTDQRQLTLVLGPLNGWKAEFAGLERFDARGCRYEYSVQELYVGGIPAEDSGYLIHINQDENGAVISNIAQTSVTGAKIWKDHGNAYGTRPQELKLKLWRSISPDEETSWRPVEDAVPVWTGTDTDTWIYVYSRLPAADDRGNLYTYRVEEEVPKASAGGDVYESDQDGWQLTNTLADTIDVPVTKIWRDHDNAAGDRPEEIEVILYANGQELQRVTLKPEEGVLGRLADVIAGDVNTWSYTFTDLPEYDQDGVRIEYTAREAEVSEGYDVSYDGCEITNAKRGGLQITKTVTGTAGEKDRAFHFTLELEDDTVEGHYGDLEFTEGKAEFTLRHSESVTVSDLPADLSYRVTEAEDGEEGYRTSADGDRGVIPAGETARVSFVNEKYGTPPAARTGDGGKLLPLALLAVLSGTAAGPIFLKCLRRKKRR